MGTSGRLLRLLSLLQTPRDWTGTELAERLEVSPRTIRNDVERLRALGYPVHATRGSIGGYRLEAGASLPPLLLEDDEAVAVAIGLRTATSGAVTGIEETSLRALARLAREHFTVRFDYSDRRNTASQRRVEPYRIVNAGQRWYLVAWDLDRQDWRTFRVDRMREDLSPGPRFAPRELTDAEVEALVSRGVPVEARLHQARVVVQAPAEDLARRFGPWLGTITAIDESSCVLET